LIRLPSDAQAAASGSISFDSPLQDKLFLPAIFAFLFVLFASLTAGLVLRAFGSVRRHRRRSSHPIDSP
jgi:hypothetical protein